MTANISYAEHIRRIVDEAPPLADEQRNRIAALLRPTGDTCTSHTPLPVSVHYDEADRCLFVGAPTTDLLRHVQLHYSRNVRKVPEPDVKHLEPIFGRLDQPAIEYLIAHNDLKWIMPVQHVNNDANPLPQVKPGRTR